MRPQLLARRLRGNSLSTVAPSPTSPDFNTDLAAAAARMVYRSPLPSANDLPVYILDAAAFPDTKDADYDRLLPYVLARFPDEPTLIGGRGYEVVFFAGGAEPRGVSSAADAKKPGRPSWAWITQAYHALSRALRKRLQRLYLVHERRWVRVVSEMFSTIVSPKFRRKVVHIATLSALALQLPLEDLLVPPAAYACDRRRVPSIHAPYASGRRAFGTSAPLPTAKDGALRLPRVLRETTSFVLAGPNVGTEGLFRVNARAATLDVLKEAFDRGQKFILWKEGDFAMAFPHYREGFGDVMTEDLDTLDGYSLNTAAGLIKLWYSELREPIFPEFSYALLQRTYGDASQPVELANLLDLILESADYSPIPKACRSILTRHLFPLLSAICRHDGNRMDAKNLAVCFAPTLLRGADPLEDAKLAATVTRILEAGITHWHDQLAAVCDMDDLKFRRQLQVPLAIEDREDPLDTNALSPTSHGEQTHGILMLDDVETSSADEGEEEKPPLPPRINSDMSALSSRSAASAASATSAASDASTETMRLRRKPAPTVQSPPRYSTVVTTEPESAGPLGVGGLTLDTAVDEKNGGPSDAHTGPGLSIDSAAASSNGSAAAAASTTGSASSPSTSMAPSASIGSPVSAASVHRKPLPG